MATFAGRYPEVATENLASGDDQGFSIEATRMLAGWLDDNRTDHATIPAHIEARANSDHRR